MLFLALIATPLWGQSYQKTSCGIKANVCSMNVEVQFYSPEIVRIIKSPIGTDFVKKSFSVIKTPEETDYSVREQNDCVVLKSKAVEITLNLKTGKVAYADAKGNSLLTEKDYGTQFTPVAYRECETYLVRQAFYAG